MMVLTHIARLGVSIFVILTLSGCVSQPALQNDHLRLQGAHLELTPVTYEYAITLKTMSTTLARQELYSYLAKNKSALQVHGVSITWQGKKGQQLSRDAQRWLLKRGSSPDKISLAQQYSSKNTAVITLTTIIHQVKAPDCEYTTLGDAYGKNPFGCALNAMRWKSMVYPEKMLTGNPSLSIIVPATP